MLTAHFPAVPLASDIRNVKGADLPDCEAVMFGSPCQDLSIAGKRGGLDGERSGLFREALRIIKEKRDATNGQYPIFALWENVPGALSSNSRRDFAAVLREFLEIGAADIAWRIMDAQHFGTPQRRRRIFLVADFAGQRAEQILFESESLTGNLAPRRGKGAGASAPATESSTGHLDPSNGISGPLAFQESGFSRFTPGVGTLRASGGSLGGGSESYVVEAKGPRHTVRRLTPTECERLQCLPEGWTAPALADAPRYRLCGNGGASTVLTWIARRMADVLA